MADLNCPSRQLEIEQLERSKGSASYLVSGCGRSAQYSVERKGPPVRTSEISSAPAVVAAPPPPPAAAPAPQQGFTQQEFGAFMENHQQSMNRPPPPPPAAAAAAPPPPARPADASPAPIAAESSNSGWVCLNGSYYACPTAESTTALGAYGACRFKCAMGGNCGACVVGAGEACTRNASRDSSCK